MGASVVTYYVSHLLYCNEKNFLHDKITKNVKDGTFSSLVGYTKQAEQQMTTDTHLGQTSKKRGISERERRKVEAREDAEGKCGSRCWTAPS